MSDKNGGIIGIISKIVRDTQKFSVPRLGQISQNVDPNGKGRVLVHIPSLSWITDDTGAWCYPVGMKSSITPEVGTWVIVQWIDGNIDLPIYTGIDTKMKDMLPDAYTDEKSQVLFESQARDFAMVYDETDKVLTIGNGSESFVKGDTFDTWIANFITAIYNTHTHAGNGIPPVPTGTAPTNHLSDKIKGE